MNTTNTTLMRRVADPATLRQAWFRVESKGAKGGAHGKSAADLGADLERELTRLRADLLEGRYVPDPLQRIEVPKHPGESERRALSLPSVRDKVAQEAVRSVIGPILDARFQPCSFGYRPGLGPQKAIQRVSALLSRRGIGWAALADIDDFFGSIDHDLLLGALAEAIGDASILRLVSLWVKMGAVDGRGRWRDAQKGIAQGGVLSPLLANLYLNPFDAAMTARPARMVRYADDLLLLCRSRQEAERTRAAAAEFLADTLHLRFNEHPRPVVAVAEGFGFLGVRFEGGKRLLDAGREERCARHLADWAGEARGQDLEAALLGLNQITGGWRRYYGTLLEQSELQRMDHLLQEAMVKFMADALERGAVRGKQAIVEALEALVPVCRRSAAERRTFVAAIAHEAVLANQARLSGAARPRSVAAAVRARKRQHARRIAAGAELVVTSPGVFVGRRDGRVVVRQGPKLLAELPMRTLASLTLAARGVSVSTDLLSDCAATGVPVVLLEPPGELVAVLHPAGGQSAETGLLQLQALHGGCVAIDLAMRICRGKITNQINLLKYCRKYRKRADAAVAERLGGIIAGMEKVRAELATVPLTAGLERARGLLMSIEGRAASHYWEGFGLLIGPDWEFPGRERRGAQDQVNQLLNYGYAILQSQVQMALVRAGLNPQVSFLHALQRGKPTLVFDLMEEFRAQVVDRSVLGLLRLGSHVGKDPDGGLDLETRRGLIKRVHERLGTLVENRGRELKLGEVIDAQARMLAAHLAGTESYRSFVASW